MEEWMIILLIGCTVFATFTIEGIAGFGSAVIAMPFITLLIGIDKAVPLLGSLCVLFSAYIVCRSWRNIDLKEYFFIILHAVPGAAAGLFLTDILPKEYLISLLIGFMFFVSIKGLIKMQKPESTQPVPAPSSAAGKLLPGCVLFLGGVIQGAFSCGGPVIVMYASKALKEKSKFRATLSTLWLTTNTMMALKWTFSGTVWTLQLGRMFICALPFIICGMLFGDFLHNRTDQRKFTCFVYIILLIAAFMLFGQSLRNFLLGA